MPHKTVPNLRELPPDSLFTTVQAAEVLGIKPTTLEIWRCTGRYNLPFVKSGRLIRYRALVLLTWLDERSRTQTGQG